MKRFFIILALSITLFSCQQSELQFSCDPIVNQYVIDNIEQLSQIDVMELTTYDLTLQRAIFNSWEYRKKREVWIDKLNYVILNQNFDSLEINHIKKLIDHIQPEYFQHEYQQQYSEINSQFIQDWINYSDKVLSWDEQSIAYFIYRLYINPIQFEAELLMFQDFNINNSTNSPPAECACYTSVDYCGQSLCIIGGCTGTSGGCGFLWSQPCNGLCF